jgi:ketosteroid isomerase-like protein
MSTVITEHPNAELVRRGYEAFNNANLETLTEIFDESASWHTPGRGPLAGDRVGRDAVFAQFGQCARGRAPSRAARRRPTRGGRGEP